MIARVLVVDDEPLARERLVDLVRRAAPGAQIREAGDGDTAVAHFLLPRPNAFRDGLFKLVSTTNGVPSEDDLVATLRRGMPGSTMMGWGWMPEADLRLLAREVRRLAVRGRAESIAATAKLAGQPLAPDQALAQAEQQLLPGPDVDGNVTVPSGADAAAAGARLWNTHCASCHGEDGRGQPFSRDQLDSRHWIQQ